MEDDVAVAYELPVAQVNEGHKIRLNSVSREYRNGHGPFHAVQEIDLAVSPGEFVCLVGPSGCGKSTLLHLIAGLDRPSQGEIWLDGGAVHGPGPDRILIFQEFGFFSCLTQLQNVEFGVLSKGFP